MTPEAAKKKQEELLDRLDDETRFRMGWAMSEMSRQMTMAGIKDENPHASQEQIRALFVKRLYGITIPQ